MTGRFGDRHSLWVTSIVFALGSGVALILAPQTHQVELMLNTLNLAFRTCAISLPLGTILAVLLARTDTPGRRLVSVVLAAMLLMPLYLDAAAWDAGFGQLGWYSLFRGQVGAPWLSKMNAAVWVHAMAAVPWVTLIVASGLHYAEAELEEWALLCGPMWLVLLRVTLPRTAAAVGVAMLWVCVQTSSEMAATDLYRVRTYAEVLYTGFAMGDDLLRSLSTVLPGILAGVAMVLATAFVIASIPAAVSRYHRPPLQIRLGMWRWPAMALLLISLLLIAGMPLGNLIYKAGMTVEQVAGSRVRHWSPSSCLAVICVTPWRFRYEFGWTALVASLAAGGATAISLPLAWPARHGGRRALPLVAISAICLALPGPLIGLMVIWLLNRDQSLLIWLYDRTALGPVLAMAIRVLPYSLILNWLAFRSLDPDVLDAAACDGAGPWQRFWRIALPQRLAVLGVAWLVCFAIAAGDLACSILVVPPGMTTVPVRTFGLLHAGVSDQVAGICLVMFAVFAGLGIGLHGLLRRWNPTCG